MLKQSRRLIGYTRGGEAYSRPRDIKWQTKYHPVLGEYQSEFIEQIGVSQLDKKPPRPLVDPRILQQHPRLSKVLVDGGDSSSITSSNLMQLLRSGVVDFANKQVAAVVPKLRLGQVVYLQRLNSLQPAAAAGKAPQMQSQFGLVIQLNMPLKCIRQAMPHRHDLTHESLLLMVQRRQKLDAHPFIRVRSIVGGIGVEYKVPLLSPYLHQLHILKESPLQLTDDYQQLLALTGASNLFGVRGTAVTYKRSLVDAELNNQHQDLGPSEAMQLLSRYIDPRALSDKGRIQLVAQANKCIAEGKPVAVTHI